MKEFIWQSASLGPLESIVSAVVAPRISSASRMRDVSIEVINRAMSNPMNTAFSGFGRRKPRSLSVDGDASRKCVPAAESDLLPIKSLDVRSRLSSVPKTLTPRPKLHSALPLSPALQHALLKTDTRVYARRRQSAEPIKDVVLSESPVVSPIRTSHGNRGAMQSGARRK